MKFHSEDNGNCRVYYRGEARALYCYQDDGSHGRVDFKFYRCSKDGEPSYEVPAVIVAACPGETSTGKALNAWLAACPKKLRQI